MRAASAPVGKPSSRLQVQTCRHLNYAAHIAPLLPIWAGHNILDTNAGATGCNFFLPIKSRSRRKLFSSLPTFAMQFSKAVAPVALASIVAAAGNVTVTTDVVVTDFTTYCPASTAFVVNNKTITVTEATTLTITGPCTIPTTYVTVAGESTPAAPAESTVAAESTPASSTAAAVSTAENGAGKVAVGAVAGVAAVAAALF